MILFMISGILASNVDYLPNYIYPGTGSVFDTNGVSSPQGNISALAIYYASFIFDDIVEIRDTGCPASILSARDGEDFMWCSNSFHKKI